MIHLPASKRRVVSRWLAVCAWVLPLILVRGAECGEAVSLEAQSSSTAYCFEGDKRLSLRLHIEIEYGNHGSVPLLIPVFTRVFSYRLVSAVRKLDRHQSERPVRLPKPRRIELPVAPSLPDPQFVRVLPPGGTLRRAIVVRILLANSSGTYIVVPGGDYYVEVELDHWPRSAKQGDRLRQLWKETGVLVTEKVIISPPIRIHIDRNPIGKPCWMQID